MEDKFNSEAEIEINEILAHIQIWKNLFTITTEFFYDGWAIFLREKTIYPRNIVVSKVNNSYSIKSFEIHWNNFKEEFYEIYKSNELYNRHFLLKELSAVVYGKDLMLKTSQEIQNKLK